MKRIFPLFLIFFAINVIVATNVFISTNNFQSYSGFLHAAYCMNAALRTSTTPNPNTTNCGTTISNAFSSLNAGQTLYIYSPQFTKSYTIPVGAKFSIEIWAARSSGPASGYFIVSIDVVNSTGSVLATIATNLNSPTFTGTIKEWHTTVTLSSSITIQSGNYIRITLTAVSANFNIYWGNSPNQRPTNFQFPLVVLNVL